MTTLESQDRLVRTAKNVKTHLLREMRRLEMVIRSYEDATSTTQHSTSGKQNGGMEKGGKERFHKNNLIPVLNKMKGDFTIQQLLEKAQKSGLNCTKGQIFSAVYNLEDIVVRVRPGFGRHEALYRRR